MQPDGAGVQRRVGWQPSVRSGGFVALIGCAVVAVVAACAAVAGASGFDAWDRWGRAALVGLTLLGGLVVLLRMRQMGTYRYVHFAFAFAFAAFGLSQLSLVAGLSRWLDERWPAVADIGALAFGGFLVVALVGHLAEGNDRSVVIVYLVDAAMMTSAITFILWEMVVLPGVGDAERLTLTNQMLVLVYPALDIFAASILLLMLLIHRSPARIMFFVAMLMLAVGDTAAGANSGSTRGELLGLSIGTTALGLLCLAVAMALPAGGRLDVRRPTRVRLLLVNGLITCGLWLATWRYVIDGRDATLATVVFGLLVGLLLASSQIALYRQAGNWADQLYENIDRLRRTEDELRSFLDDLPEALVVLGRDGSIREVNANTEELTGRTRDQLLGIYFSDLFSTVDRPRLLTLWRAMRDNSAPQTARLTFVRADGTEALLEGEANLPVRDPDRVVIVLRDVTQRAAEARRLERARERFRLAFHGAPTGMALSTVPGGVLVDVNESLARMLGRTTDDLIGRTVEEISHPDDWQHNESLHRRAADQEIDNYRLEKRYVRGDGGVVWARTSVSILNDGDGGSLAIGHIEDVTEQRHNAERLEWAAAHDELTGLPNRFRFLERLGAFLETSQPGALAVLFLDIDNFKVINDSLGHGAGDQLLQAMAGRLRSVVRDRDMLARFGGDEFIVMLRDVSGSYNPREVAEQLRREIALPLTVDGAELFVTASIGITVSDREGSTTTEMLRDADAAMYRAKARGRDCVEVFAPGSHDATVLNLRTTNELRRGLERGEIVPYYQPIVQLGNGHLMGFEVLARWRHPERGLLGPDQFLPMAEEIGEVGAVVMRASLAQLGQWRNSTQRFTDLSISVNVSARQLMSSQLVDLVADALAEAGVSAGALWLEITETALMTDVKAASVALRELRSLGLHLAVDDFGTGYSSLTYLKRFPVEAIKIDRTFVNGLGIDPEDSTIVEAVVNLGHSLGLSVVAEGVETPLQLTRLRELGCDRGQGYLFGRPRPAELVEAEYSLV
jgi:diguanylate cyclase (GGDEF)-like protein/PAS domain S-box-containing protein